MIENRKILLIGLIFIGFQMKIVPYAKEMHRVKMFGQDIIARIVKVWTHFGHRLTNYPIGLHSTCSAFASK